MLFRLPNAGNYEVFVTKFSSDGSSLIYSTYLGGSGSDYGYAISLDTQGCAYITGQTASTDFPITPGAFQTTPGAFFVTKFAVDGGSLIYSTYFGSSSFSFNGIAVDLQGCAYIAGTGGVPTTPGAFQTVPLGSNNGFITKFSEDGSSLIYSTYLGGSGDNNLTAIALDVYGYAYVTGRTNSSDFPITPGAFQTTLTSNAVFVTKLALDGSALVYSTFLSGNGNDISRSIAVDNHGHASVTGRSNSTNFPVTPDAYQPIYGGAMMMYLSPSYHQGAIV